MRVSGAVHCLCGQGVAAACWLPNAAAGGGVSPCPGAGRASAGIVEAKRGWSRERYRIDADVSSYLSFITRGDIGSNFFAPSQSPRAPGRSYAQLLETRWVALKKHSSMGCAMIGFKVHSHRDALINIFSSDPLIFEGVRIDLKRHMEKQADGTFLEVPTCAFAGWKKSGGLDGCIDGHLLSVLFDYLCDCCPTYGCQAQGTNASARSSLAGNQGVEARAGDASQERGSPLHGRGRGKGAQTGKGKGRRAGKGRSSNKGLHPSSASTLGDERGEQQPGPERGRDHAGKKGNAKGAWQSRAAAPPAKAPGGRTIHIEDRLQYGEQQPGPERGGAYAGKKGKAKGGWQSQAAAPPTKGWQPPASIAPTRATEGRGKGFARDVARGKGKGKWRGR